MRIFARLTKVDEAQRLVYGRLAQEVPDHAGEIMDYEKSKPHFLSWSQEFAKATDGKSVGNVRAMHGKVAAGVLKELTCIDAEKAIDICAKVVDDQEWKKVLEGVYTGFSVGGKYLSREPDSVNKALTRYEAQPNEASLVDAPCIPTATFSMVKADGMVEERPFQRLGVLKKLLDDEQLTAGELFNLADEYLPSTELNKLLKADDTTLGDLKKSMRTFVEATPVEPAAAAPAVAAPAVEVEKVVAPEIKKGLYTVAEIAVLLNQLVYLVDSAEYEAAVEGDASPVPAKMRAACKALGDALVAMAAEEIEEAFAANATSLALAVKATLKKQLKPDTEALAKFETATSYLAKLRTEVTALKAENVILKKQPADPKGSTKVVVDKGNDIGGETPELLAQAAELEKLTPEQRATALIKVMHTQGRRVG